MFIRHLFGNKHRPSKDREVVFRNDHYRVERGGDEFVLLNRDGDVVFRHFQFKYKLCSVFDFSAPASEKGALLTLDTVDGLLKGDKVEIMRDIYGGSISKNRRFSTTVVGINSDQNQVTLSPALPSGWTSSVLGQYLLKIEEEYKHTRQQIGINTTVSGVELKVQRTYPHLILNVAWLFDAESTRIKIQVNVEYTSTVKIYEQVLSIVPEMKLREIYLKNRKLEVVNSGNSTERYWLWKEGVRFTRGKTSLSTLHNPKLACVTLRIGDWNLQQKAVIEFNLEHYDAQHFRRHISGRHFDVFQKFQELSAPGYKTGQKQSYAACLYIGDSLPSMPRLMLAPFGKQAVHVWTEHADRANARSHRAVYYGHEDVDSPEESRGGFLHYGHPVTKSVFYDNPTSIMNPPSETGTGREHGEMVSYVRDDKFRVMLHKLQEYGSEICLHTACPEMVKNKHMEVERKAIEEMTEQFGSSTWIDHDMQTVRTCISSDGLDVTSPYYTVPLWRKNGIRYFWNFASEDFMLKNRKNLDLLHSAQGTYTPTPVYWRHPTVTHEFITWGAVENLLEFYSRASINDLLDNWGVSINHHYPPFLCMQSQSYQFYYRDLDGKMIASPKFNELLAYMKSLSENGKLHLSTVGEMMNYWLAIEKIEYEIEEGARIIFSNRSEKDIKGFSFVIRNAIIDADVEYDSRGAGEGDTIVWFDFPPHQKAVFNLGPVHSNNKGT